MPRQISEAHRALPAEAAQAAGATGRFRVQLIDAGWGSSGYYPAEMLQRDGASAFPAGTHMYLDHAGMLEQHDRGGIRSVRDLAAVTTTPATYNPTTQALEADVQVLAPYRDLISELWQNVGLSITGSAVGESGEAEGRSGLVFTELTEGYSCDFVTFAGRGGKVLQVLEHAARRAREGYGLTASDQRELLCDALRETFGGTGVYLWVRDYTDEWAVFERETADSDGLYRVAYSIADGEVTFAGEADEVYAHTQYLPVGTPPPAQSVPTPTTEDSSMPEISEADLRELRESAANATNVATAAEQRAAAAEQRAQEAERRTQLLAAAGVARGRIDAALATQEARELTDRQRDAIRQRTIADLPLTEAFELDTEAFDQRVTEAVTAEREFLAAVLEQAGAGRPRGLGGAPAPTDDKALSEAQTSLTEALKGFGMSDEAAALAARGRN